MIIQELERFNENFDGDPEEAERHYVQLQKQVEFIRQRQKREKFIREQQNSNYQNVSTQSEAESTMSGILNQQPSVSFRSSNTKKKRRRR